jgi:hypothetical protein
VRWQLDFINRFGECQSVTEGKIATTPTRYTVTDLGALRCTLPNETGLATLALWLEDERGQVRCRNYVNVEVRGAATPAVEPVTNGWALRFAPGDLRHTSWPQPFVASDGSKFAAPGRGWVEYAVPVPAAIDTSTVKSARLCFEGAARTSGLRIDWPQRTYGFNYPQTDATRKIPTDVTVSINGVVVGQVQLADDPADARGVLSHHNGVDPGSYGFLTELVIDGATLQAVLAGQSTLHIRFTVPGEGSAPGGFALYGERLGCYPVEPTLFLLS